MIGRLRGVARDARADRFAAASSSFTVSVFSLPSRTMPTVALAPGFASATRLRSALNSVTGWPLNDTITSPRLTPACSAALPDVDRADDRATRLFRPRLAAMSDVTGCTVTPSCARRTRPSVRSSSITWRAMLAGIAKPMPMLPFGHRQDLRVDADELALRVDERAARVAVVDRRVGLQEVLVAAVADAGRSALRADDAHRDRLADAERVADREHDVADLHGVGVAERRAAAGSWPRSSAARDRSADPIRPASPSKLRPSVNSTRMSDRAVDHVMVGQDVAVAGHDDARPEPAAARRRRPPLRAGRRTGRRRSGGTDRRPGTASATPAHGPRRESSRRPA